MGSLHSFSRHLRQRKQLVEGGEKQLLDLQRQYEAFFQEVSSVREHELGQLATEISRRAGALPLGLDAALASARAGAEAELDRKLAVMRARHDKLSAEAANTRSVSLQLENELRAQNADLDAQEEALKARNESLLRSIQSFNDRIRSLSSGFGFFVNFFGMRALQTERIRIDQEQADVAARIDALRQRWADRDAEHEQQQKKLRDKWTELSTKASTIQTAIDHLVDTRAALVSRAALERVLLERFPQVDPDQTQGTVACPRCRTGNAPSQSFCRVCARRLQDDRPDLEGSIVEIAEVNHHYKRFSDGMRGCQELIALLVGVRCGFDAFLKSVASMIQSEQQYSLSKLSLDVPRECLEFERRFEALPGLVQSKANHPLEFARFASSAVAALDEQNLRGYFERLGQELSTSAKAQWG